MQLKLNSSHPRANMLVTCSFFCIRLTVNSSYFMFMFFFSELMASHESDAPKKSHFHLLRDHINVRKKGERLLILRLILRPW